MAKKEEKAGTPTLGEISTIRNILMGQQMVEYDARFDQVLKDMEATTKKTDAKIHALDQKTEALLTALEVSVNEKLKELEGMLNKKADQLQENIESTNRKSAHELGQMLVNIGNQLLDR